MTFYEDDAAWATFALLLFIGLPVILVALLLALELSTK